MNGYSLAGRYLFVWIARTGGCQEKKEKAKQAQSFFVWHRGIVIRAETRSKIIQSEIFISLTLEK